MQRAFFIWLALAIILAANALASAAENGAGEVSAAVLAADDVRIAAMVSRDRDRLAGVLSDELRYAHSNGVAETKAQHIDAITSGRLVYRAIDYAERSIQLVAPGVVLMRGRAVVEARGGDQAVVLDLDFLAVWRLEQGTWRLLAWQSSRRPPAAVR